MSQTQVSEKLRHWEGAGQAGYLFFCPGCNSPHMVRTSPSGWGFDGNLETPTFTPSVLVTKEAKPNAPDEFKEWHTARACHSFVTAGRIQFLGDCTHALANQTVDLPDYPEEWQS